MEITQLSEQRLLLRFNHIIDKQRALDGCPWSFEKHILILNTILENENPMQVNLQCCDFFVHIHDLPLNMMNVGVATLLGNRIGVFKELETDSTGRSWGASLRIRIGLNVNQPLKKALKVRSTSGEELLARLTYERLPNFCYLCGMLGHMDKYCEGALRKIFVTPEQKPCTVHGYVHPYLRGDDSRPRHMQQRSQLSYSNTESPVRGHDQRAHKEGSDKATNSRSGERLTTRLNDENEDAEMIQREDAVATDNQQISQQQGELMVADSWGHGLDICLPNKEPVSRRETEHDDTTILQAATTIGNLVNIPLKFTSKDIFHGRGITRRGRPPGRGI
ncbi:UNVERIFIED_CONTAM: hypothetical protein Slati_3130000 [Sesamum latifolium]|uniref:CCHC-type domain-containing protein n=1 Tax=Sesamum latifolium TaxID=2727402 RepID=A0AAW2UVB1_9LAMI